MRLTRPTVLFGLLVLALVLTTALFVAPAGDDLPALSVRSNAPEGARALRLWLEALGYDVTELDEAPYQVDPETAALFVLQPSTAFERAEVEAVADWVEGGGRLILMTSWNGAGRLLDRFQLGLRFTGERQHEAVPLQPLLLRPTVERAQVNTWDAIVDRDGLAPWLGADDQVYVGSRPHGHGSVTLLATGYPLSNAGLASADNAALTLNLLSGVPAGARLAFDEYHHGFVRRAARDWWSALRDHAWGWAALYAVALGYLYLLLAGRRFGPPLPAPAPAGRSLGEYVTSLATLYRRAGQRGYAADCLADALKRELATALGLDPRLSDADFAAAVAERRGAAAAPLAAILARLRAGGRLSEGQLLALVREVDTLRTHLLRRAA